MATVILVADDDRGWVSAGVDDRVLREPLQPDDDVLDSQLRHPFTYVGSQCRRAYPPALSLRIFSAGGRAASPDLSVVKAIWIGVTALFRADLSTNEKPTRQIGNSSAVV